MTGKLSKNFHGVGIGPLSNILAVKRHSWSTVLQNQHDTGFCYRFDVCQDVFCLTFGVLKVSCVKNQFHDSEKSILLKMLD